MRILVITLGFLAIVAGCATMEQIKGSARKNAEAAVKKRAAFELGCEQLEVSELNPLSLENNDWVGTFGVKGCDKRLVYIVTCDGLYEDMPCLPVLNSDSGEQK